METGEPMSIRLSGRSLVASAAFLATVGVTVAVADEHKPIIALTNAYYGNIWRHQMVEYFEQAAKDAKSQGLISDYIILNGDGSANQQMSHLGDLILKKVDAIVINAASETALNGILEKACATGIKVVAFDSIVSAPCAYKIDWDFDQWKKPQVIDIAEKIGKKGNIIIVRGVKGSSPDEAIYKVQMENLKNYPDIKVAATVYGMATTSVTQSAVTNVLPGLPHIDAVLDQGGGDDFGVAQAFDQYGGAYADRPPVIDGGGTANFIQWWAEQHRKNGYSTVSRNAAPAIGGAAFWLALNVLQGKAPPNKMLMPLTTIRDEDLADYADAKPGTIVGPTYSNEWVQQHLVERK